MANKKPSAATIKILKFVSKNFDVDMEIIKSRFQNLIESQVIRNMNVPSEVEREKHVARIITAEITAKRDRSEFAGKSVPVILRIESKSNISDFKKQGTNETGYRAEVYASIQDEEENVSIGKLTLWNDACETHPNLIIGETYSTEIVIGDRGSIWQCSMNEPTDVETSDVKLTPMNELISENFSVISISDVENNISKDRDDPKLVEGVVVSGWQKVTASGRDMGFIKIMEDFDPDTSILAKFSGDVNCVNMVNAGDLVYILGQTTPATLNDDGSTKYDIGMWGELIVPVIQAVIPEEPEDNDTDESDDASGDNDNPDEDEDKDISGSINNW